MHLLHWKSSRLVVFFTTAVVLLVVVFISWTMTKDGARNSNNASIIRMKEESRETSIPFMIPPPPPSKVSGCIKSHCREYLSRADEKRQRACLLETMKHTKKQSISKILENDCDFMNGTQRVPVALASAEGSGNTWVRGLLERASGICTGFNFCDYVMRMNGFIGDNINSGSVLVVKTHSIQPQWVWLSRLSRYEASYDSAIFILRNPYYALIAEWNRRLTNSLLSRQLLPYQESHVNRVPKEIWYSEKWDVFLHKYLDQWMNRIKNWVLNISPEHPVLVVRYEDLKKNVVQEVEGLLSFLNIPFNEKELSILLRDDLSTFKRLHDEKDSFEHYTNEQKHYVKSILEQTIELAEKSNMLHILKLDEYLVNVN